MLWWHWSILGLSLIGVEILTSWWAGKFLFPLLRNGRIDGERINLVWAY